MKKPSILPAAWQVPQEFRDRLGARAGRQRVMTCDGHLLLVLHAPPKAGSAERVGRFFWRSPDGQWSSNELGTGIGALGRHLDEFEDAINRLDRRESEARSAHAYFDIFDELAPLQRAAHNLYLVLQEARKVCPEVAELIDARDRAYEIQRTADLLSTGSKNSLDVLAARQAEEQAESGRRMSVAAHRLNVMAAFFFPIVTLTAVLGANMHHGLEDQPPFVFVAVILLGLLLGGVLTGFVTRK